MQVILLVQAVLLGLVEGLTEFLPVSSTGHLIIAGDVLGFTGERAKSFEIFIQLGSILGVMWYYRERLAIMATHLTRETERRLLWHLFVAFLPAALIGLLTHHYIKAYLFSPFTVAIALVVGGVLIMLIERWHEHRGARVQHLEELTTLDALKIGIAQMFSLIPGTSRAGATIMGGLLTGLSRTAATEFSFFLAMPTMIAATLFDLYKSRNILEPNDMPVFALGFIVAFVTALFVVDRFLKYVGRHTFRPFAWYRIGFGLLVLAYFW